MKKIIWYPLETRDNTLDTVCTKSLLAPLEKALILTKFTNTEWKIFWAWLYRVASHGGRDWPKPRGAPPAAPLRSTAQIWLRWGTACALDHAPQWNWVWKGFWGDAGKAQRDRTPKDNWIPGACWLSKRWDWFLNAFPPAAPSHCRAQSNPLVFLSGR